MAPPHVVDNSDWLKASAILAVAVGHTGYFFIEDAAWWSVFGRMAAPVFFFFLGYAQSRRVPLRWIWLGVILTLLDSANNGWTWVAPNILFSLALIRIARPHVKVLLQRHGWIAFAFLSLALLAALPITAELVEYGAEGWLWGLFGLCQRLYVDGDVKYTPGGTSRAPAAFGYATVPWIGLMRLLACLTATVAYLWQEQVEFQFTRDQFTTVVVVVGVLSVALSLFRRGPSRVQPPEPLAGALHFLGWHTLEIYVLQLAGSELIIMLMPELAA